MHLFELYKLVVGHSHAFVTPVLSARDGILNGLPANVDPAATTDSRSLSPNNQGTTHRNLTTGRRPKKESTCACHVSFRVFEWSGHRSNVLCDPQA
jgi:hypothetical protein